MFVLDVPPIVVNDLRQFLTFLELTLKNVEFITDLLSLSIGVSEDLLVSLSLFLKLLVLVDLSLHAISVVYTEKFLESFPAVSKCLVPRKLLLSEEVLEDTKVNNTTNFG